jgi:hypothetical protein
MIKNIPNFNEKVIDIFSEKEKKIELVCKMYLTNIIIMIYFSLYTINTYKYSVFNDKGNTKYFERMALYSIQAFFNA